jgi:hypothetical protein
VSGLLSGRSLLAIDLLRTAWMSGGLELAHRRPVLLQTMSIVDEAIEDGMCTWSC